MDYKKIMDGLSEQFSDYPAMYERVVHDIIDKLGTPYYLQTKLKEKRDFGLNKYGEYSFQGSLKNTLTSPTMEHIEEELVDAMNYLAHEHLKSTLLYPQYTAEIDRRFQEILETMGGIGELKAKVSACFSVEDARD